MGPSLFPWGSWETPRHDDTRRSHVLGQFPRGRPTPSPYQTTTPSTSHPNSSSALGAGWPGRTEIPRFRRWAWVCDLGPLSGARTGYAPETWTSLNKNLALHTALPVVDGFGGFGGFVFTHGHFGFQKQRPAPVCMILMIFLEARPRAGAIKATPATDLMVFPAVPDHSRPQVRLALSCRPRLGFGSRGLVVRSLRHLPWGSRRQAMKFRRSAAGKSRCRTPLPSRGPELSPEWQAF